MPEPTVEIRLPYVPACHPGDFIALVSPQREKAILCRILAAKESDVTGETRLLVEHATREEYDLWTVELLKQQAPQ